MGEVEKGVDVLLYKTLIKNSMDESAYRTSCRATKGQKTQLTMMGAVVPTKSTRPLCSASRAADEAPDWLRRPSDMTVKERQPTRPDRYELR